MLAGLGRSRKVFVNQGTCTWVLRRVKDVCAVASETFQSKLAVVRRSNADEAVLGVYAPHTSREPGEFVCEAEMALTHHIDPESVGIAWLKDGSLAVVGNKTLTRVDVSSGGFLRQHQVHRAQPWFAPKHVVSTGQFLCFVDMSRGMLWATTTSEPNPAVCIHNAWREVAVVGTRNLLGCFSSTKVAGNGGYGTNAIFTVKTPPYQTETPSLVGRFVSLADPRYGTVPRPVTVNFLDMKDNSGNRLADAAAWSAKLQTM
jgi:hypothetical protein